MAVHYGLDFAIFYACLLALFGYTAFWFVPVAARVVYAAAKNWLQHVHHASQGPQDGHPFRRRGSALRGGLWWEA
jgi:hypothetical protein